MVLVIPRDDVVKPRLPTELVYPLGDLVSCCIPKAREERQKFTTDRGSGVVTEEDAVEC
jgi:hypothetical protein